MSLLIQFVPCFHCGVDRVMTQAACLFGSRRSQSRLLGDLLDLTRVGQGRKHELPSRQHRAIGPGPVHRGVVSTSGGVVLPFIGRLCRTSSNDDSRPP